MHRCMPARENLSHVGAITMRKQGCAPQRDDCMASVRGLQNDGHHGQDAPHSSCCHDEAIQAVLYSYTGNSAYVSPALGRTAAQLWQAFQANDTGMCEQMSQALRGIPAQQASQTNETGMCSNSSKALVSKFLAPLRYAREVHDSHVLSWWQIHDLHSCSYGLARGLSFFREKESRAGCKSGAG